VPSSVQSSAVELDNYRERRPPISILLLAALAVAAAFAALLRTDLAGHIIGYVLGSFLCVALVTIFIKLDLKRRNSRDVVYLEMRGIRYVWSLVLASGFAACAIHSWYIAAELAARS
jgi:hypothetical protein